MKKLILFLSKWLAVLEVSPYILKFIEIGQKTTDLEESNKLVQSYLSFTVNLKN